MKRTNNILIAVLAVIALSLFAGSAQAQYKATGDDGITASPKARQLLDEFNRNHSPAPVVAEIPQMSCPKCKDKATQKVDYTARGANKPIVTISTHLCNGCETDWKIYGVGRTKHAVASHKCMGCGSENLACCNTTKGSDIATKGMEKAKNIDVAPLK